MFSVFFWLNLDHAVTALASTCGGSRLEDFFHLAKGHRESLRLPVNIGEALCFIED